MPQEKDETDKIVDEIASIMSRHDLDVEGLTNFISENSQPIKARRTKKLERRDRRSDQERERREILRLSFSGVPQKEISERLGRARASLSRTKALEIDRICEKYRQDKDCLHDLAEEYGLTTADIISIYQERQDRKAKEREQKRDRERKMDREWDSYLKSELERRKQELESGSAV